MKAFIVPILITGSLICGRPTEAQIQYTNDGVPTGLEEEIRWRVNRGRFDTASENHTRGTAYSDVPAHAGPLAPNQSITLAARHQSEDMAKMNLFQHATVPGSAYYNPVTQPNPWDRMAAEGYTWNAAGENIAAGYNGAEAAYVGWWNSTGHRDNMYNASFREIGNGYYYWSASTYGNYYTMDLGSSGNNSFFTDTLFLDANTNGIYDQGEGVVGVSISLLVGSAFAANWDLSTAVGSFAIPIQGIAGGATVQVVLSNTTAAKLVVNIPRDYNTHTTVTLMPGNSTVFGTFTKPPTAQNIGLRDVTPIQPPIVPPRLLLSTSLQGLRLGWASETGLQYQPQWTVDCLSWSNLTVAFQLGTGSNITFLDTNAWIANRRFYRLLVSRP